MKIRNSKTQPSGTIGAAAVRFSVCALQPPYAMLHCNNAAQPGVQSGDKT